ncbi:MAG: HEAT repeat domain-containing protein [Planctomycetota bacterium]|jgi:HEAT repeat protein
MRASLKATFQFLAKTENQAAIEVLIAGLDYPHRAIRTGALRALLDRRNPEGHREVFQRLSAMDEHCREVINERPERLDGAVSDALQNPSPQACAAACDAIVSFRLYGVLPALTSVLVDTKTEHAELLAKTALKLTESFYAELSGADDQPKRKQRDNLRDRITSCLEDAVRKFHRHKRTEVVEALLLVAKPKNATLRQLLQRAQESSHQPIIEQLGNSSQGGVIRLLLGFLEDPQMPRVINKVLFGRCDVKFIEHLLWTVGPKPSKTVAKTLSRVDSIAWAEPGSQLLDQLDDKAQEAAVALMLASSIDRQNMLEVIKHLLLKGKPEGRRAAAKALEQFEGPEISALVVKALEDEDAQVRAALLVQLRPRNIPDAYSLLIRMIDSPEEEVKQALRKAMPEFTLRQFLANIDEMEEQLRPTAGHLVRRIDSDIATSLAAEMESPSPVARRRAVLAASAMGLAQELEETVIKLLSDEDHRVRAAVAQTLADCKSVPTWEALRDALLDRSVVVKQAAEQSLEQIRQHLLRQAEEPEASEEITT